MKKTEENLIGKVITLYLDGGWEVTGLVKSVSDSKIALEQEHTGGLYLVFREKVSCLRLIEAGSKPLEQGKGTREKGVKTNHEEGFPMNDIGYNDSGMSIPRGMLENLPEEELEDDDDLSMSFGGDSEEETSGSRNNIDFRVDDDS
jgi:hypothetical protein